MGVRLLEDRETGQAVMYCSTSGWAFGPLLRNQETALKFIGSFPGDLRLLSDDALEERYQEFSRGNVCIDCGHLRETDCQECKEGLPFEAEKNAMHLPEYRYHIAVDDDGDCSIMCINEPEPAPGEQYVCRPCARRRELKAAKQEATHAAE